MAFEYIKNPNDVLDRKLVDKQRGTSFRKISGYPEGFTCELLTGQDRFLVSIEETFEQGKSIWRIQNISFPENFQGDKAQIKFFSYEALEVYRVQGFKTSSSMIAVKSEDEKCG